MVRPEDARAFLDRRFHKQALAMEERRARAQDCARALVKVWGATDPSLRVVIGFGSSFETWRHFRPDSDIDLGIWGGDYRLLDSITKSTEFEISIVELVDQPKSFTDLVHKNGVLLYGDL